MKDLLTTKEYTTDTYRIGRGFSCVFLTSLSNAGVRGKTCEHITLTVQPDQMALLIANLNEAQTYEEHKVILESYQSQADAFFHKKFLRAITVEPANYEPISIENENMDLTIDYDHFVIAKRKQYQLMVFKLPKQKNKILYNWIKKNQETLKSLNFIETLTIIKEQIGEEII